MRRRIAISVAILVTMAVSACNDDDAIVIGNVRPENGRISFVLANTSSSSGDVVYWVRQNDVRKCERIFNVDANTRYEIAMTCSSMQDGDFSVGAGWAKKFPNIAAIATRAD